MSIKSFFSLSIIASAAFSVANAQLATVCANVAVSVPRTSLVGTPLPPVNLGSICLCEDVTTGLLTGDSLNVLRSSIAGNGVLGLVGDVLTSTVALVAPTTVTSINQQTASCQFPSNAVSTCSSTACTFTCNGECNACPGGTTLTAAGGTNFRCAAVTASTRKRRSEMHARSLGACPFAQTACAVPRSGSSVSRAGYECINLTENIESCGGCRYPLAGEPAGQDCTEIPGTDAVSCVRSQCVIDSCRKGFSLSADGSKCL